MERTRDTARERRRVLLDIARRRQRPGSGSRPWDRSQVSRMNWPDLNDVLRGIPWAVVGAVATRRYMPERATADLDIVVLQADAGRAAERMTSAGFRKSGDPGIGGSSWRALSGESVDVIAGAEPWWPKALDAASGNLDERGSPVLTLPYLVLMKLLAGRLQDLADVARMLGYAGDDDLNDVRALVNELAADVGEDLESIIVQGRLETGRQ